MVRVCRYSGDGRDGPGCNMIETVATKFLCLLTFEVGVGLRTFLTLAIDWIPEKNIKCEKSKAQPRKF